ncbi:MAG: hypothetical protein HFF52_08085 [Lawsonibacter sp.]|nr:hypothetical protein [Lawsonibacter sp.]
MKENKDYRLERIVKLEEAVKILPVKLQNALFWAVENCEVLQEMGRKSEMTLEEIESAMKDVWEEESYALLMLLCITKSIKESKENEEI